MRDKPYFNIIHLENEIREIFSDINKGTYQIEQPDAFEEMRSLFHLKATLEDSIKIIDKRMELI
tara:strand:+ start:49 stop:240 length:192 start_codon:yes stop_codon:yes gene_type:complete